MSNSCWNRVSAEDQERSKLRKEFEHYYPVWAYYKRTSAVVTQAETACLHSKRRYRISTLGYTHAVTQDIWCMGCGYMTLPYADNTLAQRPCQIIHSCAPQVHRDLPTDTLSPAPGHVNHRAARTFKQVDGKSMRDRFRPSKTGHAFASSFHWMADIRNANRNYLASRYPDKLLGY